ncbi:hypothetical protein BDQ17DRAFT_1369901 [Cyathus striatus]|nr:hypothetical protein BDQ17DRAFT_1369901 [Cyathus striatus]
MYLQRIPFDIVELIIDEISSTSSNAPQDLKSCALTTKSFLEPAQRRLFRSVSICEHGRSGKYRHFKSALESSPALALHVRKFHFRDISMGDIGMDIVNQPSLPRVLGMFKNLVAFNMEISFFGYCIWKDFSPDFKQAFVNICLSPSLVDLSLAGIRGLPPVFMEWFTCIPTLSLSYVEFNGPQEFLLQSLTLGDIEFEISSLPRDDLLPQAYMLGKLVITSTTTTTLRLAFSIWGNNKSSRLTTLSFPTILQVLGPGIDIGGFPKLHTLDFFADIESDDPFGCIRGILTTARDENEIQQITVKFFEDTMSTHLEQSDPYNWVLLDAVLSHPRFTQLKKASFTGMFLADILEDAEALVEELLPKTHEKGILDWVWIQLPDY